jgi:hypothetical protein
VNSSERQDLDRYITGNWGEDSVAPDPPDTAVVPMVRVPAELLKRCRICLESAQRIAVAAEVFANAKLLTATLKDFADLESDLADALAAT